MTLNKTTNNQVSKVNKFKILRALTIIISFLLAVNLISAFFLVRSSIYPSLAEEQLLCLKICEQGVGDCDFGTCANLPTVTTQAVTDITQTTATGNGTVVSDGGDTITERGTVMATSINPTTSDTKHTATGTTGAFTTSITGLSVNTTYYVRAYAINGVGTNYGSEVSFITTSDSQQQTQQQGSGGRGGSGMSTDEAGETPKGSDETEAIPGETSPPPSAELKKYLIIEEEKIDKVKEPGQVQELKAKIKIDFLINSEKELTKINKDDKKTEGGGIPKVTESPSTTFRGTTNIKDARILISIRSKIYHGTTYADSQGNWEWTTPDALELGLHVLEVEAISPYHPGVRSKESYEFQVIPKDSLSQAKVSEPAPVVTHQPVSLKDIYILDLDLKIPEDGLTPTNQLDVHTGITSFDPTTKEAFTLTYTIYDSNRARIYVQKKEIVVQDQISDLSRLVASFTLSPGNYLVAVELVNKQGQAFVATDSFTIEPHKFTVTPFLTLTTEEAQLVLLWSSVTLYLLLLLLIYLLYREYQKVRLALHQVTEKDLFKSGMIS